MTLTGHWPHNDNGTMLCGADGEPWPCVSSAERLLTGPQPKRSSAGKDAAVAAAKTRKARTP